MSLNPASFFVIFALTLINTCRKWQPAIIRLFQRTYNNIAWRFYNYQKVQSPSSLIAAGQNCSSSPEPSGLLRLPPEVRLQIYHYAFPQHRVVQPEFRNGKMRVRFGLLSAAHVTGGGNASPRSQYIRSVSCSPSNVLRMTLEDRGSFLHQSSPRIPTTKLGAGRLICGDGDAWYADQCPGFFGQGSYTALLQSNRTLYREVLDELYGKHTFSFFGPEMLDFFLQNASLEGARLVRNVHLAVPIPSEQVALEKAVSKAAFAARHMTVQFPNLRYLDVEFMFHSTSTSGPDEFWTWIRDHIFGSIQFERLEDLVIKASVLHRVPKEGKLSGWDSRLRLLRIEDGDHYAMLKNCSQG